MQEVSSHQRYTNIPFPGRKYKPGVGIHPNKDPNGSHIPEVHTTEKQFDMDTWRHSRRYCYAIDLFNAGYWWEAHEVLEDLWVRTGRSTEIARFIQGIIQIAAALLKDSQSVRRGASRLKKRGLSKLRTQSGVYLGIRIDDFVMDVENYLESHSSPPPKIILWGLDD